MKGLTMRTTIARVLGTLRALVGRSECPHPYLCFHHGGSEACEESNRRYGFECPRCHGEQDCITAPTQTRTRTTRRATTALARTRDRHQRPTTSVRLRQERSDWRSAPRACSAISHPSRVAGALGQERRNVRTVSCISKLPTSVDIPVGPEIDRAGTAGLPTTRSPALRRIGTGFDGQT